MVVVTVAVPQAAQVVLAAAARVAAGLQTEHPGPQILAAVVAGHQMAVLA